MKVTIIIPNYNGRHFMAACLDSLRNQTYRDFQIVIVDNASSDGSLEFLRANYPEAHLLPLDKNYGFSKAVNAGIEYARTPYVILLNNDTAADKDYVSQMVRAIESAPDIFSVSSKMIQMYHPELIDSTGDLYTVLGWGICRGNGQPVSKYTVSDRIFTACAGAAIYRRSVFQEIGLFDEHHFAYLEDIDIGYRAQIYGYRNIFCSGALVRHVGSGTSGSKYNSFKVKLSARNSVYLNYKNMPAPFLIINALPILAGHIIKAVFFISKGFGRDYLRGLAEGLSTFPKCRKVPFKCSHMGNYIKIEARLILNTFSYIKIYLCRLTGR